MAKEFLDSSARINNTEKNTGRQGGKFSLGRFALRLLGSAGLMASPLIVACAPDAKAVSPLSTPEPARAAVTVPARPTATPVGVGSVFIPTGNEEIDSIQKRLLDSDARGKVQEDDILKFNQAIEARAKATATAEAQKPATPEKKPIFSKLFPGIDISNAEIIPYTDAQGTTDLVAINLDAGVKIEAPLSTDYYATAEANAPFSGSWAVFSTGGRNGVLVIGNYTFLKKAPGGAKITEGEPFAVTTETDHKNQGGKTVVVQIARFDPTTGKFFTPKEEVEKYFPGIYSKPIAEAINYQGPINAVITHHYSGGPNDSH